MTSSCLQRLTRRGPLTVALSVVTAIALTVAIAAGLLLAAMGVPLLPALALSVLPVLVLLPALGWVIARLACALDAAEQRARALSISDPVTGLHNSRFLYEMGAQQVAQARRYSHPLTAVAFRLDCPTCEGSMDTVLRSAAARLRIILRECDILCRLDDDTFMALLPETDADGAEIVVTRLAAALADDPAKVTAKTPQLSGQFGVAAMTRPDLPHLLDRARAAIQTSPPEDQHWAPILQAVPA